MGSGAWAMVVALALPGLTSPSVARNWPKPRMMPPEPRIWSSEELPLGGQFRVELSHCNVAVGDDRFGMATEANDRKQHHRR